MAPKTKIVLLPGMDGTGLLFAAFVDALGQDHTVEIIPYPHEPLGYAALEDFVRSRLPTDSAYVLLGESFAGPIAISLAASKPPGLTALILCCSFASNPVPYFRRLDFLLPFLPMTTKLSAFLAPVLLGRFNSKELRGDLREALGTVHVGTLRARLHAVLNVDYSAKAAVIFVPIAYLKAANDRVVSSASSRQLMAICPRMETIEFDAPHLLLQTACREAAEFVRQFIRRCEERR
jgi:pimeloyl-[acyl-carrier protein] methyl ester esterase